MNKRALACTPRYPKYLLSHYMDLHHCPQGDPRNGNRWSSWLRGLGTSWREPPETGFQMSLCISWIYLLVLASFVDGTTSEKIWYYQEISGEIGWKEPYKSSILVWIQPLVQCSWRKLGKVHRNPPKQQHYQRQFYMDSGIFEKNNWKQLKYPLV